MYDDFGDGDRYENNLEGDRFKGNPAPDISERDLRPRHQFRDAKQRYFYETLARKREQERLMRSAEPRPPAGPHWELIKANNPEIPESELKILLTASLDYLWFGAACYQEPQKGTDIDLPGRDKPAFEGAPYKQEILRVGGRTYTVIRDFSKKEETERGSRRVSDKYFEVGLLPGGAKERQIFDDTRDRKDLRKLENYQQIISIPAEEPHSKIWAMSELGEDQKDQLVGILSHLTSKAWQLRQLVFVWTGRMITDEEFAEQVRGKIEPYQNQPEKIDSLFNNCIGPDDTEKYQVVLLLDLLEGTGLSFEELYFTQHQRGVSYDVLRVKAAQAVLAKYNDLPGFRTWVNEATGKVRIDPAVEYDNPSKERPHVGEVTPVGDKPAELTVKDKAYLEIQRPERQKTVYDESYDMLMPELRTSLKGDMLKILDMLDAEREARPESSAWNAFALALLRDKPDFEPKEKSPLKELPTVVNSVRGIREAILLGSRHVVCAAYSFPGNSTSDQLKELAAVWRGQTGKEWSPLFKNEQGETTSFSIMVDFGKGDEEVAIEYIEKPFSRSANDTFFQTGKLPYQKIGMIIDHDINIDPQELKAQLDMLEKGGTFVSHSGLHAIEFGGLYETNRKADLLRDKRYRNDIAMAQEVITSVKSYWEQRGFNCLQLPDYPDLKYTAVRKNSL